MDTTLVLLLALVTKHLLVNLVLHGPYQYTKIVYGHPSGLLHPTLHGICTLVILVSLGFYADALTLTLVNVIVHYHIEWAKMRLIHKYQYRSNSHVEYWWLLGIEQYLHMLTYIGIVYIVTLYYTM